MEDKNVDKNLNIEDMGLARPAAEGRQEPPPCSPPEKSACNTAEQKLKGRINAYTALKYCLSKL